MVGHSSATSEVAFGLQGSGDPGRGKRLINQSLAESAALILRQFVDDLTHPTLSGGENETVNQ